MKSGLTRHANRSTPWSCVLRAELCLKLHFNPAIVHTCGTRIEGRCVVGWHVPFSGSSPGIRAQSSVFPWMPRNMGIRVYRIPTPKQVAWTAEAPRPYGLLRLRMRTEHCVTAPWFKFPTPSRLPCRNSTVLLHVCAAPPCGLGLDPTNPPPRPLAAQVIRARIAPPTKSSPRTQSPTNLRTAPVLRSATTPRRLLLSQSSVQSKTGKTGLFVSERETCHHGIEARFSPGKASSG